MKLKVLGFGLAIVLFGSHWALAQAACTGSLVASGITIVGQPIGLFVRNISNSCALVTPAPGAGGATLTFTPSSLATAVVQATGNGFTVSPGTPGTGTVTVSAPGFASIQVPVTVQAGMLDVDNQ